MRFSERFGHKPVRLEVQRDQIDAPLRAGLWTSLNTTVFAFEYNRYGGWGPHYDRVSKRIIVRFFKRPVDETPADADDFLRWLRKWFFEAEWHQIYDLIEFVASIEIEDFEGLRRAESYAELVNQFLEEEKSAYRLIGGANRAYYIGRRGRRSNYCSAAWREISVIGYTYTSSHSTLQRSKKP